MATRSVLSCFSQSLRRAQRTLPSLSDPAAVQFGSNLRGCCSAESSRFFQFGDSDRGEGAFHRSFNGAHRSTSVSNVSSTSSTVSEAGCRPRLSMGGGEWSSCATRLGQTVSYSSSALAVEEDETLRLASEIGYEVLGQYVPVGQRITPQAAFAVVRVGSHQFKVSPGDMIYTEKLKYADINEKLLLNKVLLMGSLKQTIIGRPIIPEAGVLAVVEEIALDEKVIVFKKKRRKNYRRTNGHRQELTRLRILEIEGIETPASV